MELWVFQHWRPLALWLTTAASIETLSLVKDKENARQQDSGVGMNPCANVCCCCNYTSGFAYSVVHNIGYSKWWPFLFSCSYRMPHPSKPCQWKGDFQWLHSRPVIVLRVQSRVWVEGKCKKTVRTDWNVDGKWPHLRKYAQFPYPFPNLSILWL